MLGLKSAQVYSCIQVVQPYSFEIVPTSTFRTLKPGMVLGVECREYPRRSDHSIFSHSDGEYSGLPASPP